MKTFFDFVQMGIDHFIENHFVKKRVKMIINFTSHHFVKIITKTITSLKKVFNQFVKSRNMTLYKVFRMMTSPKLPMAYFQPKLH
jgi:hypothetical protein